MEELEQRVLQAHTKGLGGDGVSQSQSHEQADSDSANKIVIAVEPNVEGEEDGGRIQKPGTAVPSK